MSSAMLTPLGTIHELTVTLQEVEPPVWRRIEVSSEITLARLHMVLQLAMGWHDSHLHEFRVGKSVYGEPDPEFDFEREIKDDRRTRLRGIAPKVGSTFTYVYDLGDNWWHDITVLGIRIPDPRVRYPRVVEGERACPPEDVGSVPGYERFRAAIADPADEEHEDMLAWIGGSFDPEAFSVASANRRIRRRFG